VKSVPMSADQRLKTASSRADVFVLERKYRDGLQVAESLPDDQLAAFPGALFGKYYSIGFCTKSFA